MHDHRSNVEVKVGSERSFGLVFAVVFAVVALYPVTNGNAPLWLFAGASGLFLAVAFVAPHLFALPNRLWFKLGMLLSAIVAPVVMFFVFLVAFIPIGIVLRALGRDLLSTKLDAEAESYWITREDPPKPLKFQY